MSALLGHIAVPAFFALAASCPAVAAPGVRADFINNAPVYRNDTPSEALGRKKIDTVFSHGRDEVFIVGGLTESVIRSGFEVSYRMQELRPGARQSCVWVDSVTVSVVYAPVVHIASENPPGGCEYDATLRHEMRHVNTDVITLREFMPRIEAGMRAAVAVAGVARPVDREGLEDARAFYLGVLHAELEKQVAEMNRVRFARQQQIDTRQEYLRLSRACGGRGGP